MPFMPREGPDLTFIGFMILAVFGSLVWNTTPLQSPRPHTNDALVSAGEETSYIDAPLWQDPFFHASELQSSLTQVSPCTYSADGGHLKVIAPMVNVASDKDSIERRIRRRYAMIAGLSEAGYVPENPGKIFRCKIEVSQAAGNPSADQSLKDQNTVENSKEPTKKTEAPAQQFDTKKSKPSEVRWEAYRHESGQQPDVIVAWVDNAVFADQFKIKSGLLADIFPKTKTGDEYKTKVDLIILGPANSDSLKKVVSELNEETVAWKPTRVNKFAIYSPFATANDITAVSQIQHPHFLRTIGTDEMLAKKLHQELSARKVDQLGDIAIITERDTHYGRNLPISLCAAYSENQSCSDVQKDDMHLFYYLRGIDALNQPDTSQSAMASKAGSSSSANGRLGEARQYNPPIGPGQYDYLRRLAEQIKQIHKESGGLKAIGVFGSDIYDKLLVLQAMRAEFPGVLFFTTDLDAQMIHPQHWRWTRNLIVASNFDLSLNEQYQKSFPPFRDAYQTSFYLSTLMALDSPKLAALIKKIAPHMAETDNTTLGYRELKKSIQPLIFEIGRYGAVMLPDIPAEDENKKGGGTQETAAPSIHPDYFSKQELQPLLWAVAVLMIVFMVILHQIRANSGVLIVVVGGGLGVLLWLACLMVRMSDIEPMSLTQGVSVWPAVFIRFIALMLAVVFILKSICDLEKNFGRLSRDYFGVDRNAAGHRFPTLCNPAKPKTCGEIMNVKHMRHILCRLKTHLADNFVLYVASLLFVGLGVVFSGLSRKPDSTITLIVFLWAGLLAACLFANKFICKVQSINQWMATPMQSPSLDALWKEYYERGRLPQRVIRAVSMWVMFMFVATLLFYLIPSWPAPARGDAIWVSRAVLIVSVLVMMLLIFIALDAQRLCIYWMRKLRKELLVENIYRLDVEAGTLGAQNSLVRLRRIVELVSERTNEVDRLIYYPLIIIILMIFARNNYFDNWGFPQAIGIVIGINIAMIVGAGLKLRHEAKKVKAAAMECAKRLQPSDESVQLYPEDKISAAIKEMDATQGGAFLPMRSQPVIRALFLVAGSIGLTVSEYITLFGR